MTDLGIYDWMKLKSIEAEMKQLEPDTKVVFVRVNTKVDHNELAALSKALSDMHLPFRTVVIAHDLEIIRV